MRIEVFVAVDGNENAGIGFDAEEATQNIDGGAGADQGVPIAVATFAIEINVPKIIEGQLVVVPDDKVQIIQPEIVEPVA